MYKISIIVVIYNIESLLPKCIDSILAQTFTEFELILVDDGSTDRSGKICDEYAAKDKRINTIHKKNGGTASARNAGLDAAQGEYIGFVDNDDYIHQTMFQEMFELIQMSKSDIVICDFKRVLEGEAHDTSVSIPEGVVQYFTNLEALQQLYEVPYTFVVPWNKLYHRSLFHGIRFTDGIVYDDEYIIHRILFKSKKTAYLKTPFYYYVKRKGSMVNSSFSSKRFHKVYAIKDRIDFFHQLKLNELLSKALRQYVDSFFWCYFNGRAEIKGEKVEFKKLRATFSDVFKHLMRDKEIGLKQKGMLLAFRVSPFLVKRIYSSKANKRALKSGT